MRRKICLFDARLPAPAAAALAAEGYDLLPLSPLGTLSAPVCGHADLLLFPLGGTVLTRRSYAAENPQLAAALKAAGVRLLLSDDGGGELYPRDVGFCAAVAGRRLICRADVTDPLLLSLAANAGLETVNVRQGYARCSCVPLPDGAVITADAGLSSALRRVGAEVLTVTPGHISLPGVGNGHEGFPGGACGIDEDRRTVWFVGSLDAHPDGDRIAAFCAAHGLRARSLCPGELCDVGSLFFV